MGAVLDKGKHSVLGVLVDAVDYEAAVARIMAAARSGTGYAVSALAVHGVMTGVGDAVHRYRLNRFDLITPDGQPVRWALNLLHGADLRERVYGPALTLKVCEAAARDGVPIFLYGSKRAVLDQLVQRLKERYPSLIVAGAEASKFRRLSADEKAQVVDRIKGSGAQITFVGLGCPRQEVFAYEFREALSMPVLAVGAAFDYHAGLVDEPPQVLQDYGLQWLYRFLQEPRRLWRRYLLLNPAYLGLLLAQVLRLWKPDPDSGVQPSEEVLYG